MKWYQRRLEEFNNIHNLHYNEPVSLRLHKKKYTCESCGELIPVDEVCSPSVDGDAFICDECYDELYRFFCPLCGDLDENEDCDEVGSIIILTDQENEHAIPGAYKIIKFPYVKYGEPAMDNLKRVGDYSYAGEFRYDDCYTGTVKICQTCQREILNKSLIKT